MRTKKRANRTQNGTKTVLLRGQEPEKINGSKKRKEKTKLTLKKQLTAPLKLLKCVFKFLNARICFLRQKLPFLMLFYNLSEILHGICQLVSTTVDNSFYTVANGLANAI